MKRIIIIIVGIFFSNLLLSQEIELDATDLKKCNHRRDISTTQQIQYFQYPGMNKYDQKFLRLDVKAEPGSVYISGNVFMTCLAVATLDTFIIELKNNMTVDSFLLNGNRITSTQSADHIFARPASPLPAGSTFHVQIFYKGNASSYGIYTGTTNGLIYTASLSASYQAREWYPAKQILTDKFDSLEVWVTTSIGNRAGSIGLMQDSTDMPGGKRRFRWKSKYPINYYLPSIAVGNYMDYRNYAKPAAMAPDSILVQHYIANSSSYLSSVKTNLDKTPRFIEKFSDMFGLYPFKDEKYGHCLANIGGGMEHQTMSTMANFGTTLIAHELGHQWWGDNVTCATWSDIWLNEGFATYSECLAIEQLPSLFTTTFSSYMQSIHSNIMSSPGGSVYIPEASVYDENRLYNGRLSYNKGAAIIHSLRFEMGNTAFFQALKNFQNQYGNSTATAGDFKAVAEAACGKNLTDFFNQWYYGEGYPTININYAKQGADTLVLVVNETVSAPTITPFFKGLLELRITSAAGDSTITINLLNNNQTFKIPYSKNPGGIVVDPNNWMINQTGQITTPPACLTAYEPNETTSAAINLTSGVAISAGINTSTDADFYKITTAATSNITCNLTGPSGVDFNLFIYNSSGVQIGAGTGTSATESVSLTGQVAGTYFIKVAGNNGAFSNTCYSLSVTATAVSTCRSTYDNTSNGSITGAATIPFNTDIKGLIEVSNDVDHYKFIITTGGSITLTLATLPANYNLRLLNSAGSVLKTSAATSTRSESISTTVAAGTYYARVYPSGSSQYNSTSCYTLKVTLVTATRSTDMASGGAEMSASSVNVFPNPAGKILNISLDDASGFSDIQITDTRGRLVMQFQTTNTYIATDVSTLSPGIYMLSIRQGNLTKRARFIKIRH